MFECVSVGCRGERNARGNEAVEQGRRRIELIAGLPPPGRRNFNRKPRGDDNLSKPIFMRGDVIGTTTGDLHNIEVCEHVNHAAHGQLVDRVDVLAPHVVRRPGCPLTREAGVAVVVDQP